MNINTDQLKALLGSEEAAQRFVKMFLDTLPGQMEVLRRSLAERDWETASLTAHGLKSQFRYLGLNEGADLLQLIENEPENSQAGTWVERVMSDE